jgi:hypothetical protein
VATNAGGQKDANGGLDENTRTLRAMTARESGDDTMAERRAIERLRAECTRLEQGNATLRAEYDGIIRRLAQRALVEQGVGRLAAMELVDAQSHARGERKGLLDLARGILTEPGVVAVGPAVNSPPLPGIDGQNIAGSPPGQTSSAAETEPYAWSVFDEVENQGYLNLYHLPQVPADQALQLWVKPVDAGDYQHVGAVPSQFYGGSGSLYYKLPESSATPVEILITQEPRNAPPAKPKGAVVLHGP